MDLNFPPGLISVSNEQSEHVNTSDHCSNVPTEQNPKLRKKAHSQVHSQENHHSYNESKCIQNSRVSSSTKRKRKFPPNSIGSPERRKCRVIECNNKLIFTTKERSCYDQFLVRENSKNEALIPELESKESKCDSNWVLDDFLKVCDTVADSHEGDGAKTEVGLRVHSNDYIHEENAMYSSIQDTLDTHTSNDGTSKLDKYHRSFADEDQRLIDELSFELESGENLLDLQVDNEGYTCLVSNVEHGSDSKFVVERFVPTVIFENDVETQIIQDKKLNDEDLEISNTQKTYENDSQEIFQNMLHLRSEVKLPKHLSNNVPKLTLSDDLSNIPVSKNQSKKHFPQRPSKLEFYDNGESNRSFFGNQVPKDLTEKQSINKKSRKKQSSKKELSKKDSSKKKLLKMHSSGKKLLNKHFSKNESLDAQSSKQEYFKVQSAKKKILESRSSRRLSKKTSVKKLSEKNLSETISETRLSKNKLSEERFLTNINLKKKSKKSSKKASVKKNSDKKLEENGLSEIKFFLQKILGNETKFFQQTSLRELFNQELSEALFDELPSQLSPRLLELVDGKSQMQQKLCPIKNDVVDDAVLNEDEANSCWNREKSTSDKSEDEWNTSLSEVDIDLSESFNRLKITLGDRLQKYANLLEMFFSGDIAREEFEAEICKFLSESEVWAHTDFFWHVLKKFLKYIKVSDEKSPYDASNHHSVFGKNQVFQKDLPSETFTVNNTYDPIRSPISVDEEDDNNSRVSNQAYPFFEAITCDSNQKPDDFDISHCNAFYNHGPNVSDEELNEFCDQMEKDLNIESGYVPNFFQNNQVPGHIIPKLDAFYPGNQSVTTSHVSGVYVNSKTDVSNFPLIRTYSVSAANKQNALYEQSATHKKLNGTSTECNASHHFATNEFQTSSAVSFHDGTTLNQDINERPGEQISHPSKLQFISQNGLTSQSANTNQFIKPDDQKLQPSNTMQVQLQASPSFNNQSVINNQFVIPHIQKLSSLNTSKVQQLQASAVIPNHLDKEHNDRVSAIHPLNTHIAVNDTISMVNKDFAINHQSIISNKLEEKSDLAKNSSEISHPQLSTIENLDKLFASNDQSITPKQSTDTSCLGVDLPNSKLDLPSHVPDKCSIFNHLSGNSVLHAVGGESHQVYPKTDPIVTNQNVSKNNVLTAALCDPNVIKYCNPYKGQVLYSYDSSRIVDKNFVPNLDSIPFYAAIGVPSASKIYYEATAGELCRKFVSSKVFEDINNETEVFVHACLKAKVMKNYRELLEKKKKEANSKCIVPFDNAASVNELFANLRKNYRLVDIPYLRSKTTDFIFDKVKKLIESLEND